PALLGSWPPVTAHEPRIAVLQTVLGGVVTKGELSFAMTPLELDGDPTTSDLIEGGFSVDLEFRDATFTNPELPIAVRKSRGVLRIRDKALSVRLASGLVSTGAGGDLKVTAASMSIPTLGANPARANMTVNVEGPASAVVSLAETFSVPQLKNTPLKPDDVSGNVSAEVSLRTPLGDDVPDSAREWSIDARLMNVSAAVPIAGQTFSDANVEVLVNPRRLAARGRAKIDGLTVDVNYSEIFNGEKSGAARFVLTEKDRRQRGFDTGDMLRGPVVMTLEQEGENGRLFNADITEAKVTLPLYSKAAGAPLRAEGAISGEAPAYAINDLEVTGGTVAIRGDLTLDGSGFASAAFSQFALSKGDDVRVKVARDGKTYLANIEARRFDGRQLMKQVSPASSGGSQSGGKAGKAPPLRVTAGAQRFRIGPENVIAGLNVAAAYDGKRLNRVSASGKLDDVNAGSFALELKPGENGARRLQADVTELGRYLKAFDFYNRMRGGRTTLDARLDEDGLVTGRLTTKDFVLANEKTLEDIIRRTGSSGPNFNDAGGPLGFAPSTAIDGMSFDSLVMDFTKRGDRILISEALMRGPILGGTASGAVDLKSRTILLNGTLIPAYGVNNLFGRVPLFGEILGGGREGGLIGVTFRLVGSLDNPQLVVNPMSAIAPGIFRRIFEYR
ncbi:MAG: AsmA-like C-terminal domain-containing protein, partial [Pseudomonadota bacterium]